MKPGHREPDRGLDSPADLRLLERLLFFELACRAAGQGIAMPTN